LAFRSCVEIVSSILISSKISLLGYTVLRRLRCKYGAIMLRMASVLQIAPPDAIRRIQRVQTVTIAWMIVEALVSLFAQRWSPNLRGESEPTHRPLPFSVMPLAKPIRICKH